MSDRITIQFDSTQMRALLDHAKRNGTVTTWADIAADWMDAATKAVESRNARIAELEDALRWRKASEELPPEVGPQILMLFESRDVSVVYWDAYYADGGNGCTDGFAWVEPCSGEPTSLHYGAPTHWLPIPEIPEQTP